MSRTIEVSDETYELIKGQIEGETKEKNSTKLQIKTLAGEALFESEKTTIKEAVEDAVSGGADLEDANLVGADLRDANLVGAYLEDADLEDADLRDANLRDANLVGANLRDADFFHAKFYGRGGNTRIKKNQIDDFLKALGVIAE